MNVWHGQPEKIILNSGTRYDTALQPVCVYSMDNRFAAGLSRYTIRILVVVVLQCVRISISIIIFIFIIVNKTRINASLGSWKYEA